MLFYSKIDLRSMQTAQKEVMGLNLFHTIRRLLKDSRFRNFNYIVVLGLIAVALVNYAILPDGKYIIADLILFTVIGMIYLQTMNIVESGESKKLPMQLNFEARAELVRNKFKDLNDAYWEFDLERDILDVSENLRDMTGYEVTNSSELHLLIQTKVLVEDQEELKSSFMSCANGTSPSFEGNFRLLLMDGRYHWFNIKGVQQPDGNGSSSLYCGLITDISSRKKIEDKMNYMAYYDTLTGLPNKAFFQNFLMNPSEAGKKGLGKGALILIDIDDFKNINDTLGHDYGDQLLKIFAELLKVSFGEDYKLARAGGDEFLLLVDNYHELEDVMVICEGIINMLNDPIELGDKSIYTTVSMGVALYQDGKYNAAALIKDAETAMYQSKETGKNKYSFYDLSMGQALERKMKIGNLLREAVYKEELSVVYQPQYHIKTNELLSMEALVRWNNRELGNISPGEFIHIAETNGTINAIGKWVLEEVCRQSSIWKQKGYRFNSIAVNISPIQLQDEGFVSHIKNTILECGIEPNSLEIEITESLLLGNMQLSERKLHAVKNFGVKIAIDDFGTGYSSLNYLTFLPLDTVKIDKSFIDNITVLNNDKILAQNIIKLSHDLDMKVVAEGVETKEQLEILNHMNCDIIQGYFLSKPLGVEAIEKQLQELKSIERS